MFKRKKAVKHQYKITFLNASGLTDGSNVKLSWKRGSKSQNQGETPVKTVENGEVTWNHTVSILCTLFGTSSGGFEEKDLVLELVEVPQPTQKKGKKIPLGKIVVNLSDLVSPTPGQSQTKYHTVKSAKKGGSPFSLEVSYQTDPLGESDAEAASETDMGDELSAAEGGAEEAAAEDPFVEVSEDAEAEKKEAEPEPTSPSKTHAKKKSKHHGHEKSKTDAVVVAAAVEGDDAAHLKKQLEEMTKERDELKQTVEIMKKKQSKKSESKDDVEQLKKQNKENKETIDDLKSKLDKSEKKVKKLEEEAAAAAVAAASGDTAAAAAVTNLQNELNTVKAERDSLKTDLEKAQSENSDMKKNMKKQKKESQEEQEALKKQLDESQKRVKQLEADAAAAAVAAASGDAAASAAVATLQSELDKVKAERDSLKTDLEKAQSESTDMKSKNEDLKKNMKKQKKESQDEQEALKKQLDESQKRVKELEAEASAAAVAAASGDAAASAAVANLKNELDKVKADLEKSREETAEEKNKTEKAKKESKKSAEELKKVKKEMSAAESKHQAEVAELNAHISELEDELDEIDKEKSKPTIAGMLAAVPAEKDSSSTELQGLKDRLEIVKELLDGSVLKTFSSSGKTTLAERMLERLSQKQAQQNMFDESRYKAVTEALAIAVHASFDGAETPLFWVATLECMLEELGDANPCEIAKSDNDKLLGSLKNLMYDAYVAAVTVCCNALERVVVSSLLESAPDASSGSQKTAEVIAILADALKQCKNARLPQAIRRTFVAQLVHGIDALLVNAMLSRQEFCCCKTGYTLRRSMTSLESWLQRDPDTVGARKQLCHAREAANFFVMDKTILSDDSAVSAAFSALNIAQLARLLEYFRPDDLNPETVDTSLVREMNRKAMDASSGSIMLDPVSLI